MSGSPPQDTLEIEVTDFGPIAEAKLDLRPLTVFVGPSNTGKSYLAILIYALYRCFGGGFLHGQRLSSLGRGVFRDVRMENPPKGITNELAGLATEFLGITGSTEETGHALPASISRAIFEELSRHGGAVGDEICRCFGVADFHALTRKESRRGARIVLRPSISEGFGPLEHVLVRKGGGLKLETGIPEGMAVPFDKRDVGGTIESLFRKLAGVVLAPDSEEYEGGLVWYALESLAERVLPRIVGLPHAAHYLPADRTGVMHAHGVVVSALIGGAARAGLRPEAGMPLLSGVSADFLEQLIAIDDHPPRKPERDLGAEIEKAILAGSVRVERSEGTGYPRFVYRPDGWAYDLPLMNASSMVSELAPVVLYLRHLVEPGDVLIVEEPEAHLHPAMQVEFTRQLAELVCAGVRVIVTTHSEWLLEELANIVRRSQLPKSRRRDGGVALRPGQVGAWLFRSKRRPKGSVVEEVELDVESGLYPTDYDVVSERLYNESVKISNGMQGSVAR